MKNFNIAFQQTVEACYLTLKAERPEALDRVTLNVNLKDCPDFLLPFKAVRFNSETVLRYRQPEHAVSLQYKDMVLNKKEFVRLYANLLMPFIKGKDWFLDYHNLYIHPAYIFIDKKTETASYMYLPVQQAVHTDAEILAFFKKLLTKADIKDDRKFLVNLFQYFERGNATLLSLYQFLLKETDTVQPSGQPYVPETSERNTVQKLVQEIPAKLEQIEVKKPQKAKHVFPFQTGKNKSEDSSDALLTAESFETDRLQEDLSEDEIINALFGEKPARAKRMKEKPQKEKSRNEKLQNEKLQNEKLQNEKLQNEKLQKEMISSEKSPDSIVRSPKEKRTEEKKTLFGRFFGGKKAKQEPESPGLTPEHLRQMQNQLREDDFDDGHTVVLEDSPAEGGCCLRLVFSSMTGAPENIRITPSKDFITIGRISRDENRPDAAFPPDFKGVGRKHARLERRADSYYLVDLGSVNHTYLDGEALIPNRPYLLKAGSEVAFTSVNPITYRVVME